MSEHPIEGLMTTAMDSIRNMIDVNTIIGEPIETINNVIIIPVSKVGFGFAAGGSEFKGEAINEYNKKEKEARDRFKNNYGMDSTSSIGDKSDKDSSDNKKIKIKAITATEKKSQKSEDKKWYQE